MALQALLSECLLDLRVHMSKARFFFLHQELSPAERKMHHLFPRCVCRNAQNTPGILAHHIATRVKPSCVSTCC